ncbi:MAG: metallophosphoesterase [Caldibacillus debilis]|nr:metallophosphoesterase [Caldibacillus debilis]MBO2481836.1 metallophosphoesterase [Bacillaceae bacterium]MBY6271761.1 metallophosphoesterase [Bacillaceae bacterium]OUM89770.1 MAG: metallophosphoesterase [Caldibacillus debilis]REJ18163.1 MAG: metallophosphoesterase [Caldibacillus debilis]
MQMFFAILISAIGTLLFHSYKNTKKVSVNTIRISKPGTAWKKLRILHLSDLHLEKLSISPEELYRIISNKKVDLIAITGDFLDRKRTIRKLPEYLQVLQKVKPAYGIYAVFGNHDYMLNGESFETLKNTLEENGCVTLQNEHVSVPMGNAMLNIIGIDDFSTNRSDLNKSFHRLPKGFNLVLTHDPNVVLHMKKFPYDYLLSGHFHGGQIHWPKPFHLVKMGKLVRMNMIKGLHVLNGRPFYISEGLGQTGVNIRLGSRPEITIHEIV